METRLQILENYGVRDDLIYQDAGSGRSLKRPGRQWLKTRIRHGGTIVFARYTDGRGSRDNLGTDGSRWPRRTADRRGNLILGTSLLPRTRNLSSPPPVPLATCPVQPALAKLRPDGPHSRPHSIGQRHAHPARRPRQRKSRPLERGLRTTPDAVRPAGGWETPLLHPSPAHSGSGRPRIGRRQLRQRNRLAAQPGRSSRAFQPHGRPHAQVASQAAHQAMDRNNSPAGAGAGRPVAADVPPAAGPETRRRYRNRPGLLDPRPGAGSLPDGPATIPAQPVRTERADRGGMDSGVHRRRRPLAGRAGRTDAGVGKGAHRHRGHRTAIHPGPSRPPGVHNNPGRPSGTRRHGYRKPGATRVRLRPRRLAVRLEPSQPGGPEQPGTAPATPPPGRRMAKAPGHSRQLSIPALPQAGGAARTQPRGRDADHPAG